MAPGDVDVDVSINDDRGIRAARWLVRCQEQWPALRPLTLLLKAVLRVLELHDVSQGRPPLCCAPRIVRRTAGMYYTADAEGACVNLEVVRTHSDEDCHLSPVREV